ncbi:hypothetical protein PVAP13_9NG664100 [Panicum virgatum]|uniref:Uncharacterized protein n=1 Tax=Panicum virgatum TaxID=38727 RepID=A0A8T0MZC4_PANVG|nr:hypothetical protein PVAP13_9NG664100 [Panicum virgatum]KAG2541924.1 hypothetical protein PVAP13_9NG664100 [Panicum virgatum]
MMWKNTLFIHITESSSLAYTHYRPKDKCPFLPYLPTLCICLVQSLLNPTPVPSVWFRASSIPLPFQTLGLLFPLFAPLAYHSPVVAAHEMVFVTCEKEGAITRNNYLCFLSSFSDVFPMICPPKNSIFFCLEASYL